MTPAPLEVWYALTVYPLLNEGGTNCKAPLVEFKTLLLTKLPVPLRGFDEAAS